MIRKEREEAIQFFARWQEKRSIMKKYGELAIEALDKCDKIEKIIDSNDADFIANYVRGLFAK